MQQHSGTRDVERGRWLAALAALQGAGATGVNYAYSVYSGALKARFNLSQGDVENIGLAGNLVMLVSFALGALADRWGPRRAMGTGGMIMTVGYGSQWVISRFLPGLSSSEAVLALCITAVIGQFGANLVTGSVFATCVRNFPSPSERGSMIGLVKAAVGLAGAIVTQIYVGFVGLPTNSVGTLDYILVLAIFVFVLSVLPSRWLYVFEDGGEGRHGLFSLRIRRAFGIEAALAAVSVLSALIALDSSLPHWHGILLGLAILIILLWLLLIPALSTGTAGQSTQPVAIDQLALSTNSDAAINQPLLDAHPDTVIEQPLLHVADARQFEQAVANAANSTILDLQKQLPEMTMRQMLGTTECYLQMLAAMFIIGAGYTITINLNQILESAYGAADESTAVTLFAVGNAGGRLLAGFATDALMKAMAASPPTLDADAAPTWWEVMHTRPFYWVIVAAIMASAHLCMLLGTSAQSGALLYSGVILAGISFGHAYPLLIICTGDLFGREHLGGNYMLYDGYATVLSSFVFGKLLPGAVYQSHAVDKKCLGSKCFSLAFTITASMCAVSALVSTLLARKSVNVYRVFWAIGRKELHED
jgi:MFS family permease